MKRVRPFEGNERERERERKIEWWVGWMDGLGAMDRAWEEDL